MNDDATTDSGDDLVTQNDNQPQPVQSSVPSEPPLVSRPVPQDIVDAGHDVPDVETDSPESLDEAISQGDDIGDEPTDKFIP
jgi:hypothetical protein